MSLTASKLYMNWTGVSWLGNATGAVAIPIDEVTDVEPMRQGTAKRWYADASPFARATVVKEKIRRLTVKGGNIAAIQSIPEDDIGTFTATLNDLHNGAVTGGGALLVTLNNAVIIERPFGGKVNEYATGNLVIEGTSPDGNTDPMIITAV